MLAQGYLGKNPLSLTALGIAVTTLCYHTKKALSDLALK